MPKSQARKAALRAGLRSAFELSVAGQLDAAKVKYDYESESFEWLDEVSNAKCLDCGKPGYVTRKYTPDFFLENGVIIEAKGRFTVKDRKIALAMKEQGRDIRLVFQFDNKLSRKSTTRYTEWCDKHDIECAVKEIPEEWIK